MVVVLRCNGNDTGQLRDDWPKQICQTMEPVSDTIRSLLANRLPRFLQESGMQFSRLDALQVFGVHLFGPLKNKETRLNART